MQGQPVLSPESALRTHTKAWCELLFLFFWPKILEIPRLVVERNDEGRWERFDRFGFFVIDWKSILDGKNVATLLIVPHFYEAQRLRY